MKFCSSCGKPPTHPNLVLCDTCKQPFVESSGFAPHLTKEDVKGIARELVRLKSFWAPFIFVFLVSLVLVWKGTGWAVKKLAPKIFTEQLTKEIKVQFSEPRISNTVVSVASAQASNLMQGAILPEIVKFHDELSQLRSSVGESLFAELTLQTIADTNTSQFFVQQLPDKNQRVFLMLAYVPIARSIEATVNTLFVPTVLHDIDSIRNFAVIDFEPGWEFGHTVVSLRYFRSTRDTNIAHSVEIRDNQLIVDQKPLDYQPTARMR